MKNEDELCCALALVTIKALVDADGNTRDPSYHNLKLGRPVQEQLAKELDQLAGFTDGLCCIPELEQIQTTLPEYQIKVMSIDPPHMIIMLDLPSQTKSFASSMTGSTTTDATPFMAS